MITEHDEWREICRRADASRYMMPQHEREGIYSETARDAGIIVFLTMVGCALIFGVMLGVSLAAWLGEVTA